MLRLESDITGEESCQNRGKKGMMDAKSLVCCSNVVFYQLNSSLFGILNTTINNNPLMMTTETTLSSLSSSHQSLLSTDCNSSLLNKKKKQHTHLPELSDPSFFGRPGPEGCISLVMLCHHRRLMDLTAVC